MATIVGVQFQKNGKIYNFDTNNLDIRLNDYVIADTSHGVDLGQVMTGCRQLDEAENNLPLKKLIRVATEKDLQTSADNREKEREAFSVCQKKIAEHKLDMKLVSVEYSFDNSKALFYFTSNGRVDFRSLVKDLASVFKMRIELRQIGVRDEARMIGGLGPCGRQICCGSFLEEFQPVSIKMAKEQNLSLNPTKISGVCGRLMCCLKYEQDHYEQARKIMPRIGKEVVTPDGSGTVSDLNILKETVFVRITNGDSSEIKEYPLDKISRSANAPQGEKGKIDAAAGQNPPAPTEDGTPKDTTDPDKQRTDREHNKESRRSRGDRSHSKNKPPRKNEKSESNPKNAALGKPVMRENPNKTVSAQPHSTEKEVQDKQTREKPSQDNQSPEKKDTGSSTWADAVRKAMDSIS